MQCLKNTSDIMIFCLRRKKPYSIRFFLYEMPRTGKSIEKVREEKRGRKREGGENQPFNCFLLLWRLLYF